jgi:hypothetical protein
MRIPAYPFVTKYRAPRGKDHDREPAMIDVAALLLPGSLQKLVALGAANPLMQGRCAPKRSCLHLCSSR